MINLTFHDTETALLHLNHRSTCSLDELTGLYIRLGYTVQNLTSQALFIKKNIIKLLGLLISRGIQYSDRISIRQMWSHLVAG